MEVVRNNGTIIFLCLTLIVEISASFWPVPLPNSLKPYVTLTESERESPRIQLSNLPFLQEHIPPKKKMKTKKLLKRLGNDFDSEWMSIGKPSHALHQVIEPSVVNDVSSVNVTLYHTNGSHMVLEPSVTEAMRKWLQERVSCPIHYEWIDKGSRWWPRWLKTGICRDNKPCSWPPGMHCVPADNKILHLLLWHCRSKSESKKVLKKQGRLKSPKIPDQEVDSTNFLKKQRDKMKPRVSKNSQTAELVRILRSRKIHIKKGQKKCKWIRVRYPVTSQCYCTC